MKARWMFVVLVALVVAVVLWTSNARQRPQLAGPVAPEHDAPAPDAELESLPHDERDAEPDDERSLPQSSRVELEPTTEAADLPEQAVILGRFVLPDGTPAVGMPIEMHGWQANAERVKAHGEPASWADPESSTDGDGRFRIRFDPPRAYQFKLEARRTGYGSAEWRWSEIAPGQVVDLGEVELVPGGTIEGRIVGMDGQPAPGEWWVYARSTGLQEWNGRDESQVMVAADHGTAHFRAEDVMPGRVELRAYDEDWTETTIVEVRSGQTVVADIVTETAEELRRVFLIASLKGLTRVTPDPEHVGLVDADGERRRPEPGRVPGWHSFTGLDTGEYELVIDDPRFEPWRRSVRAGEEVTAELLGRSSLVLVVRDPSGSLVEDYSVEARLRNVNFWPNSLELDAPAGIVTGLVPGDYRITVRAGELLGLADVDGLGIAERRTVEVTVGAGGAVRGRVLHADGAPVASVEVAALPKESTWLTGNTSIEHRALVEKPVVSSDTDRDGAFRIEGLSPGEYFLRAKGSSGLFVWSEPFGLEAGGEREGLDLVLPRGSFVTGRIVAPPGATCAGLHVSLAPKSVIMIPPHEQALGPDGSFDLGPVPPGPCTLVLTLQRPAFRRKSVSMPPMQGSTPVATVELRDGERLERDFEVQSFPGTLALDVFVNGTAARGVTLAACVEDGARMLGIRGDTDGGGTFGPAFAFAGANTLFVGHADEGWRYTHPELLHVSPGRETRARIDVEVADGTVTFFDAQNGEPLKERVVHVLASEGDEPITRAATDAEGRARWTLATGEYRFRLEPVGAEITTNHQGMPTSVDPAHTVPFTWTSEGPAVSEVRL